MNGAEQVGLAVTLYADIREMNFYLFWEQIYLD
jgi:hypothetical protein